MDIFNFVVIVLCFVAVAIQYRSRLGLADWVLLTVGLGFTCAADFCLVMMRLDVWGVKLFCVAQLLYLLRYFAYLSRRGYVLKALLVITLCVGLFVVDNVWNAGLIYATLAVMSFAAAIVAYRMKKLPFPNGIIIIIALSLFLLCDICVALRYIISGSWQNVFYQLIWLFYLPSQILLAASGRDYDCVWKRE